MLTHVVFFRMKEEYKQEAPTLVQRLLEMKGQIPQLLELEAGEDVLHSARSYDAVLVTRFASLEDMQAYQVHPVHVKGLEYIRLVTSESVTVDYITK